MELKGRGYPIALISMCAPDAPGMWRTSALAPFVDVSLLQRDRAPQAGCRDLSARDRWARGRPAACVYCGDGRTASCRYVDVGMTSFLIADPAVDAEESLTPEREEWDGASVADLRELLAFLPGPG